ncbi:MAG: hypothetical protein IT204_13310 [Fimbriimonadaceae bacterium]|nr:hypothetical protein [Fimbriimonadaceae bacterium]
MRRICYLLPLLLLAPVTADVVSYCAAPDACYRWSVDSQPSPGITTLKLTSQRWQGIEWQHTVTIVRPNTPTAPDLCVLLITGGDYEAGAQEMMAARLLANLHGLTFAVLWDIPNQPLWNMREDDLIAHTFVKFLETKDDTWPLLFAMTKSAVRAMDALQAWSQRDLRAPFKRFITTGASKRGWTTWFSGVVDPRVVAIMPMVYDNLNLTAQMPHQLATWGHYSPQIEDYTRRGLQAKLAAPEGAQLGQMVDPFTYRQRVDEPKLLIGGTNDAYWTVDALNLYRDQLVGEVNQLYVPNSGHGLADMQRVLHAATGFSKLVATGRPRPQWTWTHHTTAAAAEIMVTAAEAQKVDVWAASVAGAAFDKAQWATVRTTRDGQVWRASVPRPADRHLAVFAEATFRVDGQPFPLSTTINLVGPGQ